jgi:predicted alpha/beta-hydrolase family hydrolase
MTRTETALTIGNSRVSALLDAPDHPTFVYVLAHGAGAGMRHPFLEDFTTRLLTRGAAVYRFNFPYMEMGKNRVDSTDVSTATIRAAVFAASVHLPRVPIIAGGKSYGGRMTSEAQAREALPGVRGIAFLGFPLHPPERQGTIRAEHLERVTIPLLFLQGSRDEFARADLLEVTTLKHPHATLVWTPDGDHSFNVRKKITGKTADDVMDTLADDLVRWAEPLCR